MNFTEELNTQELTQETALVVQQARAFIVDSTESFQAAGAFLKTVKDGMKKVTDFFADSKAKAAAAHKAICESEKKMLDPLKAAETTLKSTMGAYDMKVREEKMRAEAEARRKQQEEAERLMREAIAAEEAGDAIGAEVAMQTAEIVNDMKPVATVQAPKASGISTRMKWVAEVTDERVVPPYINGVCVRPIDTAALVKMAQLSNGTIEVPGIKFRQEAVIAVR
jgi:hypothetical protein